MTPRLVELFRTPLGNALGHILEGLIVGGIAALATQSPFVGWLAQSYYFLGRERRDHEVKAGLNPVTDWYRGWNVLTWSADGQRDLAAPVIVNGLIAAAVHFA